MPIYWGGDEVNNSKPPKIGVMQKVYVYEQGSATALIGYGYVITYADGKQSSPDLFDIAGNKLPEGWYTLQVTSENHLVVVPRMVQ